MTYDCYDVFEEVQTGSTEHYAETRLRRTRGQEEVHRPGRLELQPARRGKVTCQADVSWNAHKVKQP